MVGVFRCPETLSTHWVYGLADLAALDQCCASVPGSSAESIRSHEETSISKTINEEARRTPVINRQTCRFDSFSYSDANFPQCSDHEESEKEPSGTTQQVINEIHLPSRRPRNTLAEFASTVIFIAILLLWIEQYRKIKGFCTVDNSYKIAWEQAPLFALFPTKERGNRII